MMDQKRIDEIAEAEWKAEKFDKYMASAAEKEVQREKKTNTVKKVLTYVTGSAIGLGSAAAYYFYS